MISPSELRLVDGISAENYGCLADHISTLPGETAINLNTTDAVIISTFSDKISLAAAEEIVKDRPEEGYSEIADFRNLSEMAHSAISFDYGIALKSDYFLVRGQADFGDAEIKLHSVMDLREASVKILGRSIGTY